MTRADDKERDDEKRTPTCVRYIPLVRPTLTRGIGPAGRGLPSYKKKGGTSEIELSILM